MPDYSGAINQGLQYKLGEVPSLLDWNGLSGKGTSDDTSAINGAIAQAPRGGMVHVPKGVYAHGGNLILPAKPITFFGDGYANPLNWYQRVGSPVTPNPDNLKNLGSFLWNSGSGQHFKPGTPSTQAFVGNGSARTWTLANRANYITGSVNGSTVTFGVTGDTGKDFYLGADRQTITQDAGGVTLTGGQTLTVNYGAALVDMQLALRDMGFFGGSGVIKIPNLNTTLNFDVESVISMFCTGTAFEIGADDVTGNTYMSRFSKCYFYNNATGILNHFACDMNVDDCFFQDHTSRALDVRGANTRITKNTFISGNTGTEDIQLLPTGFSTATALYNLRIWGNKFGNENSVTGETRVKIRVGNAAQKAANPFFYVANLDVFDNTFVGTYPGMGTGTPTACIALFSPLQDSRIHHNDFITATYAVDDSNASVSSVAGNNQFHANTLSFGAAPFKSGGIGFSLIDGNSFGPRANPQLSAGAHLLTENMIAASEAFGSWSLSNTTITTGQADPFGGTGACLLTRNTTPSASAGLSFVTTSAGSIVLSVWLKAGSAFKAMLQLQNAGFTVQTQIEVSLDSTWRRYSLRLANQSAAATLTALIYPGDPSDTISETIVAFGAQVNSGDEAGGYRKTTGATIVGTVGLRAPYDLSVGRDVSVDRNLAVTGDSVTTGNSSATIATVTQGFKAIFTFAYMALLQAVSGFGVRFTLNNDGTLRMQRSSDGFTTVSDTPLQLDSSGNLILQKDISLQTLAISLPLKVDASAKVISAKIDLGSASDIQGAAAIANGGTGATTAVNARTNLSVYSKAEVDTLLAGKANVGATTSGPSAGTAHTHTEN